MKAIVLSGGGSKGSYQIGAWKALKKLKIKYDIVTGTSVGALNGALLVQNSYYKAVKLWKNINMKTRKSFADIGQTIGDLYGFPDLPIGESFLSLILDR